MISACWSEAFISVILDRSINVAINNVVLSAPDCFFEVVSPVLSQGRVDILHQKIGGIFLSTGGKYPIPRHGVGSSVLTDHNVHRVICNWNIVVWLLSIVITVFRIDTIIGKCIVHRFANDHILLGNKSKIVRKFFWSAKQKDLICQENKGPHRRTVHWILNTEHRPVELSCLSRSHLFLSQHSH